MKTTPPSFRTFAFTLTELMVVVVIIGVLASVIVPVFMKATSAVSAKAAAMERMQRIQHDGEASGTDEASSLPFIHSLDLEFTLSDEPQRVGLEVYNRFLLRGEGSLMVEAPDGDGGAVSVSIPFPEGTIEAADVSLRVIPDAADELPYEPDDVVYQQSGIHWRTPTLAPGERLVAEIRFTTLGTERLDWSLPPSHRLNDIRLSLDLANTSARSVTSFSLTPSEVDAGGVVRWEYENLVSDRHIVVEIPGAQSPSGRLIQLLRFMAVAVLMFGGGFLYMNERDCPGRLDEFRLGHFSLLALIYSLFFIVFAVLIYREQVGVVPALVISAVCSLPLLVMHVARIANLRFALFRILPLAIVSLAVVVNGVYGGAARDYVFLAILVSALGYITATYRPPETRSDLIQQTATA